jgi:hypothetical protein
VLDGLNFTFRSEGITLIFRSVSPSEPHGIHKSGAKKGQHFARLLQQEGPFVLEFRSRIIFELPRRKENHPSSTKILQVIIK